MSEENTQSQIEGNEEAAKTFTQEQVNQIVKDRLARAKAEVPADYEELKNKAALYDEQIEAEKTEIQKLAEERDKLNERVQAFEKAEEHRKAVTDAVAEYKLSNEDAQVLERMSGDVTANAELLATLAGARRKYPDVADDGEKTPPAPTFDEINAIKDPVERVKARAQVMANQKGI